MARRRFFVDSVRGGEAELGGDEAAHLARVLRASAGQRFEITDGASLYLAEIVEVGKGRVRFRVIETLEAPPSAVRLVLLASLVKFDRMDWMIEKATELGVEAIVPVCAQRSEKGLGAAAGKRLERWRKIALQASQQSRRVRRPEIGATCGFEAALRRPCDYGYFLEETPGARPLVACLPAEQLPSDRVAVLVGPEGGWTDAERERLKSSRFTAVSLGGTLLRAETAAVAALSLVSHWWWAATVR